MIRASHGAGREKVATNVLTATAISAQRLSTKAHVRAVSRIDLRRVTSQLKMCRARCAIAARWGGCMGQTSDAAAAPFPMCDKSEYFGGIGACFYPMRGNQIPFSTLLAEIAQVTAVILLLWACSIVYTQVGSLAER